MTQERQIFIVRAEVVNSSGGYQPLTLDGQTYPVVFDSNLGIYSGNIDKCLNYAKAEWHKVVGRMLKDDSPQLQTAVLMTADGRTIGEPFHKGAIAPVVVPDPEPTPEETPEEPTESEGT